MSLLLASSAAADNAVAGSEAPSRQDAPRKTQPGAQREVRKPEPKAAESPKTEAVNAGGDVKMSGISILGNQEAPKSLVIVPWKSSRLGDAPGISRLLDDSTQPVDKDVFMRELAYYEIRTNSK